MCPSIHFMAQLAQRPFWKLTQISRQTLSVTNCTESIFKCVCMCVCASTRLQTHAAMGVVGSTLSILAVGAWLQGHNGEVVKSARDY